MFSKGFIDTVARFWRQRGGPAARPRPCAHAPGPSAAGGSPREHIRLHQARAAGEADSRAHLRARDEGG